MNQYDHIGLFQRRLAETVAWCKGRGSLSDPLDGLRTLTLRPPDLGTLALPECVSVVERLTEQRAKLLQDASRDSLPSSLSLRRGNSSSSTASPVYRMATSGEMSQGFFDVHDLPPWDTWIEYVIEHERAEHERWRHFDSYLVSWVPTAFVPLADKGISVNGSDCICWAADMESEFTSRLLYRGPARLG